MTGWMTSNAGGMARRRFPFGAWGVALLAAALGAIAGLLIPMAWIEEVSWQLYLDQLIAAARAPLGVTARLVAAAILSTAVGLLGWLLALVLKVQPAAGAIGDWLASLRGPRVDDEPDAPALRAADRHPDAPARRPFSASRDVPVDADQPADSDWDAAGDEELLLDAHFDEALAATVDADPGRAERWEELEHVDDADEMVAAPPPSAERAVMAEAEPAAPAIDDLQPEPLDLSVARLDELIARLESGLSRRQMLTSGAEDRAPAGPAVVAAMTDDPEPVLARGNEQSGNEISFPQDPALAAALATLRRMNRTS